LTITAAHLAANGQPAGGTGRIALPVAGDDAAAKATVAGLVEQLGFDAVDAGRLRDSWRQQPGTPVYTTDLDAEGVRAALAEADPSQTAAWRARWAEQAGSRTVWLCIASTGTWHAACG
jgi:predicted dinucleotide-binding enzyme